MSVPHYEPTSSGQTYAPEDLPAWFKKEVREMKKEETCIPEREAMQRCLTEKGFQNIECGRLLENYDSCQTKHYNKDMLSTLK